MDVMEVEEVEDEEELEGMNCPWDVATQTEKEVENMEDIDHSYYSDKSERDLAVREKTAKLRNNAIHVPPPMDADDFRYVKKNEAVTPIMFQHLLMCSAGKEVGGPPSSLCPLVKNTVPASIVLAKKKEKGGRKRKRS